MDTRSPLRIAFTPLVVPKEPSEPPSALNEQNALPAVSGQMRRGIVAVTGSAPSGTEEEVVEVGEDQPRTTAALNSTRDAGVSICGSVSPAESEETRKESRTTSVKLNPGLR